MSTKSYQKLLRANNGVDFDDLLMLTEQLWRREPDILQKYQRRWQYVHVDEFQDCNLPQYKLIRLLGYGTDDRHAGLGNVCVVGDDDQMIYTWRGASAENVLRFESDFPEVETVILDQNYRSTQTILDAAQGVVRRNSFRKDKKLWTEQGKGEKVVVHRAYNEEEEGLFTAREILRLLGRGDIEKRGDVAVMYRTNAQSRAVEEQFLHLNIPYKVIGSRKFYERKEIKDMIAYLRLLANPTDELSLQRIINVPNRKIGAKTLNELQSWATSQNIPTFTAIQRINEHPTLGKAAKVAIEGFAKLIADLAEALHELSLPELVDRIAERSGYGPELRAVPEEELDRWANVLELRHVAENYSEIETSAALELFLENVALVGGADTAQTSEDGSLVREENSDFCNADYSACSQGVRVSCCLHRRHGRRFAATLALGTQSRATRGGASPCLRRLHPRHETPLSSTSQSPLILGRDTLDGAIALPRRHSCQPRLNGERSKHQKWLRPLRQ